MSLISTNTFAEGMNLDIPEMQVSKTMYRAALNATLTTSDGNELIMLNDLGNAKILDSDNKIVTLKLGYVPVGIKEYNGVLYIASYNPKTTDCEIGTFPSPEYSKLDLSNYNNLTEDDLKGNLVYKYAPLHNLNKNGVLSEFNTKILNFDLEHQVDINILASYDGSVNLILTDNNNKPRLINSAFAVQQNNTFTFIKHIGDNNTNIYNIDFLNDEINLQRLNKYISVVQFNDLHEGGQLQVGTYVIYVKASDEDYNTTNVIALSGLIPIFAGSDADPKSTNGLLGLTRTNKLIDITVKNIDPQYTHLQVYYSVATSNKKEEATTTCYKISDLVPIDSTLDSNNAKNQLIHITGYETVVSVDESEINEEYFIISKARTITINNNITFAGNVEGLQNHNYEELEKLSLKIYPYALLELRAINSLYKKDIYDNSYSEGGYSSARNVCYKVTYHPGEIYRFGIVYIYLDGSKSSVFDILGVDNLELGNASSTNETYWNNLIAQSLRTGWNNKGTCRFPDSANVATQSFSIGFYIASSVKLSLQNLGIAGFYFVRQKRIPLLLCLAYTTPIYENAYIPAIRYGLKINGMFLDPGNYGGSLATVSTEGNVANTLTKHGLYLTRHTYFFESFFTNVTDASNEGIWISLSCESNPYQLFFDGRNRKLNTNNETDTENRYKLRQDYLLRLVYTMDKGLVFSNRGPMDNNNICYVNYKSIRDGGKYITKRGYLPLTSLFEHGAFAGFCPEYECNQEYYDNIFTGGKFTIRTILTDIELYRIEGSKRVYYTSDTSTVCDKWIENAKIISVSDGVTSMGILRDSGDFKEGSSDDCWLHKKNVFFSSKIGEPSDKLIWKQVGGSRVFSLSTFFVPSYMDFVDKSLEDISTTVDTVTDDINKVLAIASKLGISDIEEKIKLALAGYNKLLLLGYNEHHYPTNFVRGLYGPYLGIYIPGNYNYTNTGSQSTSNMGEPLLASALINIYIPGYSRNNIDSYMNVVKLSGDPYYAISDRYSISNTKVNYICYRGDCHKIAFTHRVNRNFLDPSAPTNDIVVEERGFLHKGDKFECTTPIYRDGEGEVGEYRKSQELQSSDSNRTNVGDMNAVQLGSWVSFTVNSTMNLLLRGEDRTYPTEKLQMGLYRSFYPLYGENISGSGKIPDSDVYNKGYSVSGGVIKDINIHNDSYLNSYYKNRIYYSNITPTVDILNGNRIFKTTHYKDFDSKYGAIVKLISVKNYLFCILEHGVTIIEVLPEKLINEGSSGTVYINTSNILHDKWEVISDKYGSIYESSIIQTPYYIYGVDTYAKKIWRISLSGSMEIISDDSISAFLNDNLTINNENLLEGTRMLRALYNYNKYDVMFTYYNYNDENPNNNVLWNICYNEKLSSSDSKAGWTTFYSWIPETSENIGNCMISFDHFNVRKIIKGFSNKSTIFWKHGVSEQLIKSDILKPTVWYDTLHPFELEFLVTESPENYKIFDNLEILGNKAEPESFHYEIIGETYEFAIDKSNEYYRQERTKELWYNAALLANIEPLITYDDRYKNITPKHRALWHYELDAVASWKDSNISDTTYSGIYVKSMVPWNYYIRTHNPNLIESYYYAATSNSKDYSYLTGTELVYDKRTLDIKYQIHANGVDINGPGGVLRGNMKYSGDRWLVLINPMFFKEKNESDWTLPPIVINSNVSLPTFNTEDTNNSLMAGVNSAAEILGLTSSDFDFTLWGDRLSTTLKDKYIKIRIRYSGKLKVLLQAIRTMYQINAV